MVFSWLLDDRHKISRSLGLMFTFRIIIIKNVDIRKRRMYIKEKVKLAVMVIVFNYMRIYIYFFELDFRL